MNRGNLESGRLQSMGHKELEITEWLSMLLLLPLLSCFSRVWFCATLGTAAHQVPLSMRFSMQEYCSGLPFSSPVTEQAHIEIRKKNIWVCSYWVSFPCSQSKRHGWGNVNPESLIYCIQWLKLQMFIMQLVGKRCLLWPVCSLDKTLLAFALLHSVLQGQVCLLL